MSSERHHASTTKRWRVFLAIFVLAGVAMAAWSLSGPVGETPDEDFHLASIWCGQGIDDHRCGAGTTDKLRVVPSDLVDTSQCYAAKVTVSGKCLGTDFGNDPTLHHETGRGNFTHDYPPVYFATMRLLVGDDVSTSVLRMRAFNTLLFLALTGAVMALVPPMLRRVAAWTFLLTSVPLGIWLVSSINPSGWATVSAGLFWIGLYALPDATGWRRPALGAVTVVAGVMGAGARTDSCLFTLIAVVLVCILRGRDLLRSKVALAICVLIPVAAVIFFLGAAQSDAALNSFGAGVANHDLSRAARLWTNIQNLPSMWTGSFGTWSLGWNDTPMPPAVLVGSMLPWAAIVFGALGHVGRRQVVALVLLAGALVTYPMFLVTKSGLVIGEGVQPRYLLPLLVMLTGMALLVTRARAVLLSRGQVIVVSVALGCANAFALHTMIRRHVTGLDVVSFDLNRDREWWWNIPLSPMTIWIIGSAAFFAVAALVLMTFTPADDVVGTDEAADGEGWAAPQRHDPSRSAAEPMASASAIEADQARGVRQAP